MARKADILKEAQDLGLDVTMKNTIAEIEAAIEAHNDKESRVKTETVKEEPKEEPKVAKAGKRSAKALREAEEEEKKEVKKESASEDEEVEKKGPKPNTRPVIERKSKSYRAAAEKIEKGKEYDLKEALEIAKTTKVVKFDATVELHVNLGVNPKHADQNIRESVTLPNGTGKDVKVAVFAPSDLQENAKKAGADIVGEQEIVEMLKKEETDFDVLISTPQFMPQLSKFAKSLGPKGLMPNPKSGTVTEDVAKAVKQAKAGRVEFRVDSYGIIHLAVGKCSFTVNQLQENIEAVLKVIKAAKPMDLKGIYLQKIHISTSMGPSIKIQV